MNSSIKVLVIDENPVRSAILVEGLEASDNVLVECLYETSNLLERINALNPDVILIDLENPHRDVLEQMFMVSREVKRPIAMFVDQSDSSMIAASVDAGVSTYIVDGLRKERVQAIVDVTISRFNAFSRLKSELDEARTALEERKLIDRAKGILMQQKGLSEDAAYKLLRTAAMNENKKVAEVAASLVTASELLR